MKNILSFLVLIFTVQTASSQITFQRMLALNCVLNNSTASSVQQTNDGGYIATARYQCGVGANSIYLGKTNMYGEVEWSRYFSLNNSVAAFSVQQTSDNGFILSGDYDLAGPTKSFLLKVDTIGNILWSKSYFKINYFQGGKSVKETSDGGLILTGYYSMSLIKTNNLGDTLWTKRYDGNVGYSVIQTNDKGFAVGGVTNSFGSGGFDAYVVKTDSLGNVLWSKTYGNAVDESLYDIRQTIDGGFIFCGYTFNGVSTPYKMYVVKTDSLGVVMWSKTYEGTPSNGGSQIRPLNDGSYIIVGSDGISNGSTCALKIDSIGNLLWAKNFGSGYIENGNSVDITNDGGFILSGYTSNVSQALYLIKTDSSGNSSGCYESTPGITVNSVNTIELTHSVTASTANSPVVSTINFTTDFAGTECYLCSNDTAVVPNANYHYQVSGRNIQLYNNSSYHHSCHWDFGDGSFTGINSPYHTYQTGGVFDVCLSYTYPCFTTPNQMCKTIAVNGIQTFLPKEIAETGTYAFDVTGAGFTNITNFSLKQTGMNPLIADSIIVINDYKLKAIFRLTTAISLGYWTPHIQFSNLDTFDLVDGLLVAAYEKPKLTINISGNSILRPGSHNLYNVTISNSGNVDAYFPIVAIGGFPPGTLFEIASDSLLGAEDISTLDTLNIDYDSLTTISQIDSSSLTSFYFYQPYKIPSRGSITFSLLAKVPISVTLGLKYNITAIVTKPMYTSLEPEAYQLIAVAWSDCLTSVLDLAIKSALDLSGANDWVQCAGSLYGFSKSTYNVMKGLSNSANNSAVDDWLVMYDWTKVMTGILKSANNCLSALGTSLPISKALQIAWKIYDKGGSYAKSLYGIKKDCFPPDKAEPPHTEDSRSVIPARAAWAFDPNIKTGPGNNSVYHFMNDNSEFIYTIQFENDSSATLPAQTIYVYDTLDMTKFDLGTFSFTNFSLGSKSLSVANQQSFLKDINFSSDYSVNARISGNIDTSTGVVTFIVNSIDTLTNQITTNAALGILPPDTVPPNGQGSFTFKIKLLPNATNADTIRNSASIIFDNNSPIITPIWQNIIDTIKPQSQLFVASNITTDDSVLVTFSGFDVSSGVESYEIYVSFDSTTYFSWIPYTNDTTFYFYRDSTISTVYFISIAKDSAGNFEDFPSIYDASTTFINSTNINFIYNSTELKIYPNPTTGKLIVEAELEMNGKINVEIYNLLNQKLLSIEGDDSINKYFKKEIDVSNQADGVYFIHLKVDAQNITKKFILKKN